MPSQSERRAKKSIDEVKEAKETQEDTLTPIIVAVVAALAIGLGLVAFLATFFGGIFGMFAGGASVVQLNVNDLAKVKEVLFGGDPWLIYCINNETAHYPIAPILDAEGEGTAALYSQLGMKVGVLDCYQEMPSGKTIAQKFTWGTAPPPFAFAIANGDAPIKVAVSRIKTKEELIEAVRPVLTVKSLTVDSIQKWPTVCSSRRICVVLGHKTAAAQEGAMDILTPMLEKHRKAKVVTLDTSFWSMRLGANLSAKRPQLKIVKPNDVDVVCLARVDGVKDKKQVHVGRYLASLDPEVVDNFLSDCAQQKNLVALGLEPKIEAKQAWGARKEKPEVITAEPLPSDFFKDGEPQKRQPDGKRDAVGNRKSLEDQDEKIVEDVDESDQQQTEQQEEDEGEEVEL